MKKIITIVLAVVMVLSLCVIGAFAGEDKEIDVATLPGAQEAFTAHGYAGKSLVKFGYGTVVSLGTLDLSQYSACEITYATDMGYKAFQEGMTATAMWALKSTNETIGYANVGPNENGLLGKADCVDASVTKPDGANWDRGERTAVIDLSAQDYNGEVFLSHFNSTGNEALLVSLKFVAPKEASNLALGRSVSVTINTGDGNLGAGFWDKDYLTDGQVPVFQGEGDQSRLGWYAQTTVEAIDCKVTIDLGGLCAISKVVLSPQTFLQGAQFPTDYEIQVSTDGSTWTKVAGETGHTASSVENVVLTFDETDAQFVRMAITKAGVAPGDGTYHTGFAEFEIYGYAKEEIKVPDTELFTAAGGGIIFDGKVWLSTDAGNGGSARTFGTMVNTSAPIKEAGVAAYWASNPATQEGQVLAAIKINVYKFDTNYTVTKALAPVASAEATLAGDSGVGTPTEVSGNNCKILVNGGSGAKLIFDTPLPAGQYLIEFSDVSQEEGKHYIVLPMTEEAPGAKAAYYLNDVLQDNLTGRVRLLLEGEGVLNDVVADSEAEFKHSLDALAVNEDAYAAITTNYKDESTITILEGSKLNLLGWATKAGTNVDKIYWQYIKGNGKFSDENAEIISKECSNTYRDRKAIAGIIGVNEAFLLKSGFGLDDDMMEMLGVDELEPGEYTVRVRVLFEDGTEEVVKKKFTLIVEAEPSVKVIVGTDELDVKPDAVSQVILSMVADGTAVETRNDASDPWISIPLNNIDTSVYTSFTVKYKLVGESAFAGNNVYLRDTEVNKGYSGVSGTWVAPGMDGKTERTFVIADDFPTMAGTILTGVRFVACRPGETFIIESVTFNKADEPAPETVVVGKNFDEAIFNETQIKVRGWARLNSAIDAFGYKIDDAEIVYDDAFQVDRSDVWDAFGVTKELANGFLVELDPADYAEGKHTFTLYIKAKDGTVLELGSSEFNGYKAEPQQPAELAAEINDAGKLVVTVTGSFGDKDWIGVYADGTTPGGDGASLVWWYVGANGGTFEVPFEGMTENNKAALLNEDGTVKEGKFVVYLLANDGYGLVEGTEGVTVTVEAQPVNPPETQPKTGDALVAMFAIIAVLAMSAAVVFARRKAH